MNIDLHRESRICLPAARTCLCSPGLMVPLLGSVGVSTEGHALVVVDGQMVAAGGRVLGRGLSLGVAGLVDRSYQLQDSYT